MQRRRSTNVQTFIRLSGVLLLAASLPVHPHMHEPVVGVDDPESLFVDDDPVLHRNKQAALRIMRELLQCNQWDRADEWLTERYIQHNPNAGSGRDAVVDFFTKVLNRKPTEDCGELTTEVVAVIAEDDYVTVLIPRTLPHPEDAEETYTTTWFDTWRFVDGKADEHWDPAEIITAP